MYVLFEEDGSFKAAEINSEADATLQIEFVSGKRSKIKRNQCIFQFASPSPENLLTQAPLLAADIDPTFLWEVAPQAEFNLDTLGTEYFGHAPNAIEKASLLWCLHQAPIYFHRRGKGLYQPAPPDILAAALASQEKKRLQALEQQTWVQSIIDGSLPEPIAALALNLITRPDKNTQIFKALDRASQHLHQSPEQILLDRGAWPHALALHKAKFLALNFPKGLSFAPAEFNNTFEDLPLAQDVQPYSVDDVSTTEIDDAISVQTLPDGWLKVGVHIAVPALAVTRDSALDEMARARMSTVYMPGEKIPMLPDDVIDTFSLNAGCIVPALSIYVETHQETGEIRTFNTVLERIQVAENLRHNHLDALITDETLSDSALVLPHNDWLRPLWQLALALNKKRELVRGKPETNSRIDYNFSLDGSADDPDTPINIVPRKRNAPLDRLVAEYMILANSLWGGQLNTHNLPGIYRSQQAGRVRMSTQALPHEAIGVAQYTWCTSPLRRYVDLVNQRQLLAMAEHGISAALVAPYKPRDPDLFGLIGEFESQYTTWNEFQDQMERYWCLRWLQQNNITQCTAKVLRDDLVRFEDLPFIANAAGMPALMRGARVLLSIERFDELGLRLSCQYVAALDATEPTESEADVDVATDFKPDSDAEVLVELSPVAEINTIDTAANSTHTVAQDSETKNLNEEAPKA
jgi:exoribonuclease-2